jgi:hypothetical protein
MSRECAVDIFSPLHDSSVFRGVALDLRIAKGLWSNGRTSVKKRRLFSSASLVILLLLVGSPGTAFAYLDPGSGSFVIQMLIAGFLGALLWIRLSWNRIRQFFHNLFNGRKQRGQEKDLNGNE